MTFNNKKKITAIFFSAAFAFLVINPIKRTQYRFVVEFDDIPAISDRLFFSKIDVHYRGYDVGDVVKVALSEDQTHIEFFVKIHYKGLKIPSNSSITFRPENIYGARYLDIEPPKYPSGEFIKDGAVLDGVEAYESIDAYVTEEFKNGNAGKLVNNLLEITDKVKTSFENEENKKLLDKSAGDLAIILENLKQLTNDPSTQKDIKSVIKHSSGTMKSVDEILRKKEMRQTINQSPANIKKTLESIEKMNGHIEEVSHIMPEATKNMATANGLIAEANGNLCTINTKVPPIPPSLVESAEKLVVKTDCFETEISKLLSKRAAIIRLLFGNPGKSFKSCTKGNCKKVNSKK